MPDTATMGGLSSGPPHRPANAAGRLEEAAWVRGVREGGTAGQAAHHVMHVELMARG